MLRYSFDPDPDLMNMDPQNSGENAGTCSKISALFLCAWQPFAELAVPAREVFELTYDLVVLEEQVEDIRRKVSEPLLDSLIGVMDSLVVFHEGSPGRRGGQFFLLLWWLIGSAPDF